MCGDGRNLYAVRCNKNTLKIYVDVFDCSNAIYDIPETAEAEAAPGYRVNDDNDDEDADNQDKAIGSSPPKEEKIAERTSASEANNDTGDAADAKSICLFCPLCLFGFLTARHCPNNHPLVLTNQSEGEYEFGFVCDMCGADHDKGRRTQQCSRAHVLLFLGLFVFLQILIGTALKRKPTPKILFDFFLFFFKPIG